MANKILVVDDKKEVVDFILEILELTNYQVYSASDGDEAWKIFQQKNDIALIITDINMPHLNGVELIKLIRDNGSDVPVIVMTGYGDKELVGKKIGNEFIAKPFDVMVLLELVQKYVKPSV